MVTRVKVILIFIFLSTPFALSFDSVKMYQDTEYGKLESRMFKVKDRLQLSINNNFFDFYNKTEIGDFFLDIDKNYLKQIENKIDEVVRAEQEASFVLKSKKIKTTENKMAHAFYIDIDGVVFSSTHMYFSELLSYLTSVVEHSKFKAKTTLKLDLKKMKILRNGKESSFDPDLYCKQQAKFICFFDKYGVISIK